MQHNLNTTYLLHVVVKVKVSSVVQPENSYSLMMKLLLVLTLVGVGVGLSVSLASSSRCLPLSLPGLIFVGGGFMIIFVDEEGAACFCDVEFRFLLPASLVACP